MLRSQTPTFPQALDHFTHYCDRLRAKDTNFLRQWRPSSRLLNPIDRCFVTPLMWALSLAEPSLVEFLLAMKADPNHEHIQYGNALCFLAQLPNLHIDLFQILWRQLRQKGASFGVNLQGQSFFDLLIVRGEYTKLMMVLSDILPSDLKPWLETMILTAANYGQLAILKHLLALPLSIKLTHPQLVPLAGALGHLVLLRRCVLDGLDLQTPLTDTRFDCWTLAEWRSDKKLKRYLSTFGLKNRVEEEPLCYKTRFWQPITQKTTLAQITGSNSTVTDFWQELEHRLQQ